MANEHSRIKVFKRHLDVTRIRSAYSFVDPPQAHTAKEYPVIQQCPIVRMTHQFTELWNMRKEHGISLKAHPAWNCEDRIYGKLVSFALQIQPFKFYYVENDEGRNLIISPMCKGNLVVCLRTSNSKVMLDYIVPSIGKKIDHMPDNADSNVSREFVIVALEELCQKIREKPEFPQVF